jgi:Tfp pilus assembly protein PilO
MSDRRNITWRERRDDPLIQYIAGLTAMLILVVGLTVRVGIDWAVISSHFSNELAGKQVELKALDLETAPLRGLDKHVEESRSQMQEFYKNRIPSSYSVIASRIGELQVKSGVRLSRVQYTQGKPGGDLTEISLDAGISGEYQQIMRFVNSLERDQNYFVVRSMQLTGQQGGLVNLRILISTWLLPEDAHASGLPPTSGPSGTGAALSYGKEGE